MYQLHHSTYEWVWTGVILKRVEGSGMGLRFIPLMITRIPSQSFNPQYPKLLLGPLNFVIKVGDNYCGNLTLEEIVQKTRCRQLVQILLHSKMKMRPLPGVKVSVCVMELQSWPHLWPHWGHLGQAYLRPKLLMLQPLMRKLWWIGVFCWFFPLLEIWQGIPQ